MERNVKAIGALMLTLLLIGMVTLVFQFRPIKGESSSQRCPRVHDDSSLDIADEIKIEACVYPLSSGWTKIRPIAISGSTYDLVDYQVKIAVLYDSDMQSDFDDLRFVDADGNILDYWVEDYVTSLNATVWVKIHSIPSSGTTIHVYYGNPDATSASNGDRTFVFFDNFESGTLNKWDVIDATGGAGISSTAYEGNYGYFTGTGSTAGYVQKNIINESVALTSHMKWQSGGSFWTMLNNRLCGINHYDPDYRCLISIDSNPHLYTGVKDTAWHRFDMIAETEDNTTFYFDNALLGTLHATAARTYIRLQYGWENIHGAYFDLVYLRRYVSSEPIATIGSESKLDWWPMFRHDPRHTGYSASTAPNANTTIWNFTTGDGVISSPAVADGKVYFDSYDGKIYCLNATTGDYIWNFTTGFGAFSSPAVADGKLYVGSSDTKVYCLNATTGITLWSYTTGATVFSSPAVADGVVYVGSDDYNIYALNATTGAKIWNYTTDDGVFSSPAVADGVVYVGSDDYNIYALNATTGAKIWNYTTDGIVQSSQAVSGGKVYANLFDGGVCCLNALTGALIWNYTEFAPSFSSPAVADGVVYVGSVDHNIYALNATTGAKIWNHTTNGDIHASPAVADGKVYVGSSDTKVYCLNATTGITIWSYTTEAEVISSPAVADGKVYIGKGLGTGAPAMLIAFGAHDVAVTNISLSRTVVGQNFTGTFWVAVENQGDFSEVFNVSAFYDGSAVPVPMQWPTLGQLGSFWSLGDVNRDGYIDNFDICLIAAAYGTSDPDCDLNGDGIVNIKDAQICAGNYGLDVWTHLGLPPTVGNETVVNLPGGGFLFVGFRWNTTGVAKGNYTISGMADTVLGETDIVDNYFTDDWIIVARIGDITGDDGWPDGACDMLDVATVARRFGEQCGTLLYDINYDISGSTTGLADGAIDMVDVATVARHFGETDP